jgi:flagellar motor switch protein FliG
LFGRVDVDVAFLALTAAEEQFTRRVVKRFAPKQAKLLADRLAEPGPLLLSDVERAQEEVVRTAKRLIQSARAARSPSKGTLSAVN